MPFYDLPHLVINRSHATLKKAFDVAPFCSPLCQVGLALVCWTYKDVNYKINFMWTKNCGSELCKSDYFLALPTLSFMDYSRSLHLHTDKIFPMCISPTTTSALQAVYLDNRLLGAKILSLYVCV